MKRKFLLQAFFCGCLLGANTVQSQTGSINIVSTAVPFLRISPDARAGGMAAGDQGLRRDLRPFDDRTRDRGTRGWRCLAGRGDPGAHR